MTHPFVADLAAEHHGFANRWARLTAASWHTATRCADWEIRHVAGHVLGLAIDVAAGDPGRRSAEEQAATHSTLSPAEFATELATASRRLQQVLCDQAGGGTASAVSARGVRTLVHDVIVHDVIVHDDDIVTALDLQPRAASGFRVSVEHVAARLTHMDARWGIDVDGGQKGTVLIGAPGQTHAVEMNWVDFVRVATGRADPAPWGLPVAIDTYRQDAAV